ncbi:exonuclease 3'-5' domain-containing protein 2-like [Chironomus tepperi]|uniref:exonuclease 3'-5' domain-containing protein 2-like n=1 Tax=Chironomus tepperi TaxID=113505 RepID=UPI00391EF411
MEAFGNFLKSISETLNFTQEAPQTEDDQVRRESTISESGYGSDTSRTSESNTSNNETRRALLRAAISNQAREDDDEEFETRGMRNNVARLPPNNWQGMSTGAVVGLAALAIGGYAIGKALLANEKKISESKEEIVEKIKEIEKDSKEFPVVGFDTQWTQTFEGTRRNKIALIQIASHKGNVLLIQMSKLYTYPEELKAFLRNRNIIKSGIEVLKDARYLLEDYGLVVTGTFDLRFLAEDTGHKPESLPKLANKVLDMELGRDWELIASDWNKDILDENQQAYAEKSATASVDIFKTLISFAVDDVNRSEILNYCAEYLDRTFIFYSQKY